MLQLLAHKHQVRDGFTILEVSIALCILAVGMLSAAALTAKMLSLGRQSKYMSLASILASEKLEDLNRWSTIDPQICVPTGNTSVGSLSSDVLQTTTCPTGGSSSIAYYDDVNISLNTASSDCPGSTSGCFAETVSSLSNGSPVYTTTYHSPDGRVVTGTPTSTAPTNMTFHRRWIIESNQPITGTRRITLLVTLLDLTVKPSVNFQISLVRP